MINQTDCIDGLESYLYCTMVSHLSGMYISEVLKFLADKPSVTSDAIEVTDPFDVATCSLYHFSLVV